MNGYLTSALSAMLGWVRGIASSIWQMIAGENTGSLLRYIADHWKGILLTICIMGVAADFAVYLFRWQPYKVWGSFIRRVREGKRHSIEPGTEGEAEKQPAALAEPEPLKALPAPVQRTRRRRRAYFPENEPAEDLPAEAAEQAEPGVYSAEEPPEPTLQAPAHRRRRRRRVPDE